MKIYIFGNEDLEGDNIAFKVADNLKNKYQNIKFIKIKPNQDLPFAEGEKLTILMDAAQGLNRVTAIKNIDNFKIPMSSTVHDFDLAFQLKYLRKLGKLGKVLVIALPMDEEKIDYLRIHSILRKLVAQDIQGS